MAAGGLRSGHWAVQVLIGTSIEISRSPGYGMGAVFEEYRAVFASTRPWQGAVGERLGEDHRSTRRARDTTNTRLQSLIQISPLARKADIALV